MEDMFDKLSATVTSANNLEALTRPLLELLETATGLESTYLTSIDEANAVQSIRIARNTGELTIPEGLVVPWGDTLCKRCLEQGRRVVSNVSEVWGDSQAAAALGIETYASAPVRGSNGEIIGTLCAAGKNSQKLGSRALSTLNLFSELIAQFIEREQLLAELARANDRLTKAALTDSLTELPNRRALRDELGRLLARAARDSSYILVGMLDFDGFKAVNDQHGHLAGDELLKQCAARLAGVLRGTDMLARMGGDEFAIIGPGPFDEAAGSKAAAELTVRLEEASAGTYSLLDVPVAFRGVSAGIVAIRSVSIDQALELADEVMYRAKQDRRSRNGGGTSRKA
ncbi:GGDEF domain-containing protein [Pararobbsia silviterrae]|uniref:Sensor domain-containing diguanylate cyclase n=1 Tax=Pararobbsia silviterrae TaxID=1792498 RepID=A0A494XAM4_9BURK|nr:GGDEF domain-containing protein [Pararobbsia silviterrae]RKP47805.1 sensor domain-containing diguanylate cyclase [Pararobbsia silviterrae]